MIKEFVSAWDANKDKLSEYIASHKQEDYDSYEKIVKMLFEQVINPYMTAHDNATFNIENVHEIDDGDYQGTLLFLIPFDSYQPCEYEYLMTYVGYGSCSGCDTLQAIQGWGEEKLTDKQVEDFMQLCKDILTNTIKPYNGGWRETDQFTQIEEAN
jgi:hypothetical protein